MGNEASIFYAHAEGYHVTASGMASHAEGWNTRAGLRFFGDVNNADLDNSGYCSSC
jgi:hypothetical protein